MDINSYIEAHSARFFEELFSLIRIPSISSDSSRRADMEACAARWRELLLAAGVDRAEVMPTSAAPVVFAEKIIDPAWPTVLVYGHYDVMPVEPLSLWKTDPFEPVVKDGILYARGADDDKGQSFLQLKAFEYALHEGLLRCNVKFIIEGGEEIGSPGVEEFCREHTDLLKADVILVSDTSMVGADIPSITTGLRGLSYWQVEVTGPNHDLHSGIFGGAVANPVNVLCKMIAALTDADGRITLPGFYDDVEEVSREERDMLGAVPYDEEKYKANVGVKTLFGEKGYTTLERTAIRPTFDVCGIWGGYTGEGAKTVLPSKAYAKLSCRLVPHQQHHKIEQMMIDHFNRTAPEFRITTSKTFFKPEICWIRYAIFYGIIWTKRYKKRFIHPANPAGVPGFGSAPARVATRLFFVDAPTAGCRELSIPCILPDGYRRAELKVGLETNRIAPIARRRLLLELTGQSYRTLLPPPTPLR